MTDYNTDVRDVVIFRWIMTSKMEPKSLSPDAFVRLKICQKCVCGRGSALDPLGAHRAPPVTPAGFVGPSRDGECEGRKGKGREERQ